MITSAFGQKRTLRANGVKHDPCQIPPHYLWLRLDLIFKNMGKFNMKKILLVITFAFFHSSISLAASEGDTYGGFQYGLLTYSEDGFPDLEPTALAGRYGQFVNDNISVEGRFGIGMQDDTALGVSIELDTFYGVYGVAHASSNSDVSFYGVFGFTKGKLTASIPGFSISDSDSGLSYGFGVDFNSFNIEYMLYLDEDFYDISAISFGYKSYF